MLLPVRTTTNVPSCLSSEDTFQIDAVFSGNPRIPNARINVTIVVPVWGDTGRAAGPTRTGGPASISRRQRNEQVRSDDPVPHPSKEGYHHGHSMKVFTIVTFIGPVIEVIEGPVVDPGENTTALADPGSKGRSMSWCRLLSSRTRTIPQPSGST